MLEVEGRTVVSLGGPSMSDYDILPRFVVRWADRRTGFNFESPHYFVHEDADLHFGDLIADPETLSAQEVQTTRRGDVILRTWQSPAYHTV